MVQVKPRIHFGGRGELINTYLTQMNKDLNIVLLNKAKVVNVLTQ